MIIDFYMVFDPHGGSPLKIILIRENKNLGKLERHFSKVDSFDFLFFKLGIKDFCNMACICRSKFLIDENGIQATEKIPDGVNYIR